MTGLKTIIRLSLSDYLHERLLSACAIMGLAAVLAPLLVLFGVKNGIITTMAERLIEDPRNREISSVGSGRYDQEWFAATAKRKDVAFVIPQTRTIAASMGLYRSDQDQPRVVAAELIPTAEGDPLLEKWGRIPEDDRTVVLSQPAARKLKAEVGQSITGRVGRSRAGKKEQVTIRLKVAAVLPLEAFPREAAFVRLALLKATEAYRDGRAAPGFGWPGKTGQAGPQAYPSFRLYARSIYDVAEIRDWLAGDEIEVYTKAEEIEVVRSLDRAFSLVFKLIAVVAVGGYFASMLSSVLANVNRKSRHLGVTRLIGFSTHDIAWFPVAQALSTSILGTVAAALLYLIAQVLINGLFSRYLGPGEAVCSLGLHHLLAALGFTTALSVLASAYAALRVARIEPSEVIRDV